MATMIDTLEFSKNFQQAGFDQPKAEALAGAFARAKATERDELVTNSDLELTVAHIDNKLTELRLATRADIAQSEAKLELTIMETKLDTERTARNYVVGGNVGLLLVLVALQHFAKVFG